MLVDKYRRFRGSRFFRNYGLWSRVSVDAHVFTSFHAVFRYSFPVPSLSVSFTFVPHLSLFFFPSLSAFFFLVLNPSFMFFFCFWIYSFIFFISLSAFLPSRFSFFLLFPMVNLVNPSAKYAWRLRLLSVRVTHTVSSSQWTAIMLLYSINWLVFAMEMNCVLCEVVTEFLNGFHMKFVLQSVNCCVDCVVVDGEGLLLCTWLYTCLSKHTRMCTAGWEFGWIFFYISPFIVPPVLLKSISTLMSLFMACRKCIQWFFSY